ncbi:MAG: class I SAM-dependent methyltransferase [Desulfobulbaceae bacterium]
MQALTERSSAVMELTVTWQSCETIHEEHYYADEVNMWRDIFPAALREKLLGCRVGDQVSSSWPAAEILGGTPAPCLTLPLRQWQPPAGHPAAAAPLCGRYYPKGFLRGVAGVYPQTLAPMRVVAVDAERFTVDLAHPLQGASLDFTVRLVDFSPRSKERGGRCSDWLLEALDNGPGMQALRVGVPLSFDRQRAFLRGDPGNDRQFYEAPRMVSHIDSQASSHLAAVVGRFLKPGAGVLDLMAGFDSHLPAGHGSEVTGLGMNGEEMKANRELADNVVHDLNSDPVLPFSDRSFDAVLCNLSVEYLIRPEEVLRETARVLRPDGFLLVSFSNRWFPPKVTRLWTELHEFERMGLVLHYCRPYFMDLRTISLRNWPRPSTDRHFPKMLISDPLYVVVGRRRIVPDRHKK